jgi:putative PEP-CTERM system TPR-repeat lipoprotein
MSIILFLAESLLKEGKFDEAESYADVILEQASNQPFAHYIKATSRFDSKDYLAASKHAEKALRANFNQIQLKLIAGASAYFQQNFEQAHHHLSSILKFLPSEHPARKMYVVSLLQLGKIDGINDALAGFTSSTKEDDVFLSSLSFQLAELGAYEDAKVLVNKSSSKLKDADDAEEIVRQGIVKLMLNDPTGVQNLKDAIKLAPDLKSAELALAFASIKSNDFEPALAISKKWQEKYPKEPVSYNILAAVYLKQGQLELAKETLNKSLTIQPNNLFAYNELINLAQRQGDVEEAKKISKVALAIFPKNAKVLKNHYIIFKDNDIVKEQTFNTIKALHESDKADLSYGLLFTEILIAADKNKAAVKVIESFKTSINSPKKRWQLNVIAHRNLGNKEKQQSVIDNWHITNPYHLEPILLTLDHYIKVQQLDKALTFVDKNLLANHKNNLVLKLVKMQILLSDNKLIGAKVLLHDMSKQNLQKEVYDGFQGRIYLLEKKYNQAIPLLKNAYDKFPSRQNVLFLAVAHQANGQKNDAIIILEQYLEKKPTDDRVHSVLADLYLKTQPQKAADAYAKIIKRQPKNIVILNNLAWLNMESGNLDLALKYSKKANELAPNHPNVVDTRGMVLLKSGKKIDAWKALLKAYELSKGKDHSITLNYAEVLINNKQKQEAIDLINGVRSKDPLIKQRKVTLFKLANSL